ncbi:HlyD family type I secretion periplasmic adaptor subunit [Desertibaculum subflavum]|uniref:HlyD family type I secretion periplasmic adaptor subunit n=1 Tax=Desertibaculum subflavum TaxID=2268458 RepID=UPI000E668F3D
MNALVQASERRLALPGPGGAAAPPRSEMPSMNGTVFAGLFAVFGLLGGALLWACLAHLDSAAVATGNVIVDSHRKTVQHLEGGILRELMVKEGDQVTAGQVLARLDTTQAEAAMNQAEKQLWAVQARITRLRAEQEGARQIVWPADLAKLRTDAAVNDAFTTQEKLFEARWQSYDASIEVLKRKIDQFKAEITAANAMAASTRDRLRYTQEELKAVAGLLEKGFERRPRLLELQRVAAELQGRLADLNGTVAKSNQAIASAEFEIAGVQKNRQAEIGKELQETQATEADVVERLRATTDVRQRKDVLAPQDGAVVDLKVFTSGGVIAPGAPIMDIVPKSDDLIVEARISPSDIDVVTIGLRAQVQLSAYKARRVPAIDGEVIYVSADKLTDPRTNEPYFTARVKLDKAMLDHLPQVKLSPGMPAEVYIITGERLAIDYLISPLRDSFRRAFRED